MYQYVNDGHLAQLHEDVDDAQEVGRGQSGAGVTAGHVVLIEAPLSLAQSTPVHTQAYM